MIKKITVIILISFSFIYNVKTAISQNIQVLDNNFSIYENVYKANQDKSSIIITNNLVVPFKLK
jgi:hypothetical protein